MPLQVSTNVMKTASYSTINHKEVNGLTSTSNTATPISQQAVRISTTVASTSLKSLKISFVTVATKTSLPSTVTTVRTSVLATKTYSPENKTLSTGMRESMLTTTKQTPQLSTTTNGLFSTERPLPLEPLTTYPSRNIKVKTIKLK